MAERGPSEAERSIATGVVFTLVIAAVIGVVVLWAWFFTYGVHHMMTSTPKESPIFVNIGIVASIVTLTAALLVGGVSAQCWLEWALKTPVAEKPKTGDEWEDP